MSEAGSAFFRWFPIIVAVTQLVLLPLILIALDARIERGVDRHNANLYAHPALNDLKELEKKIEVLSVTIGKLELAIARMTPRRSTDHHHAGDGGGE